MGGRVKQLPLCYRLGLGRAKETFPILFLMKSSAIQDAVRNYSPRGLKEGYSKAIKNSKGRGDSNWLDSQIARRQFFW